MIFLTVGTHSQQFNRLLKKVDELVGSGVIKDKVIAQTGNSTYKPKNYTSYKSVEERKMQKFYKNSRLLIVHGGVGTIITALSYKKPTIVVPRLKKFDEHINDHQLQITRVFECEHKILACYDISNLADIIKKGYKFTPKISRKQPPMLLIVKKFLFSLH